VFSPPTPPWYPGANAGVSFGTQFPPNPCRGHFLWDGQALWMWDGVAWQRVGPAAASSAGIPEAPIDGNLYGRENAAWVAVPAPVAPKSPTTVFYSSSQIITIPAGMTSAFVAMWGASGGSGGVASGGVSSGTGAGGYLEKFLTGLTPGLTLNYTQGAAGTAGVSGNTTGGSGGVTTLMSGSQTIGTLTCNGSAGSTGSNTALGVSLGATASGGDVNVKGQDGQEPSGGASLQFGIGGSTFFSEGADGVTSPSGGAASAGNQGNPGGLRISWHS
jgi:hypothetical protein